MNFHDRAPSLISVGFQFVFSLLVEKKSQISNSKKLNILILEITIYPELKIDS